MKQNLPRAIPGSKQSLSDDLTVSVLIDRNLILELGKAVLVILTAKEAAALYLYLEKHHFKFLGPMGEQP